MSKIIDMIKKLHELADHPDVHIKKHMNQSCVLTGCDDLRVIADWLAQLDTIASHVEIQMVGSEKSRVVFSPRLGQPRSTSQPDLRNYVSPTSLIELRPTAFESNPFLVELLQKAFEKGDRMIVPIGKVPEVGDVLQIGKLDIEAVQVILHVAPMGGTPVATVYVKVKP